MFDQKDHFHGVYVDDLLRRGASRRVDSEEETSSDDYTNWQIWAVQKAKKKYALAGAQSR